MPLLLRVALLIATAFVFTAFTVACETVGPQQEVTKEVTKEVTVVQQPLEPKKGVKGEEPEKEEPKKKVVKEVEPEKEEPKYEDMPPEVKEKLPEEAKQEIKQKVQAEEQ